MASARTSISAGSRHSGSTVISMDDANDNKKKVEQQQHEEQLAHDEKNIQNDDAKTSSKKSPLEILRLVVLLFGMMLSMFTVTINSTLVAPVKFHHPPLCLSIS